MAKNRNKKNKKDSASMEVDSEAQVISSHLPKAMDTDESVPAKKSSSHIKINKGVQMKRSKNVRKMKAIAKAVSGGEKKEERIIKSENKKHRTKSAKNLYD